MSLVYLVCCNGCGVRSNTESYTSTRMVRMYAARDGWTRPKRGIDLCKACSDKVQASREASRASGGLPDYY